MAQWLLTVTYDGTRFHGWQVQPNGITVQQTIQDALQQLLGTRPPLTGCSRTDTGVHARRFYCTTKANDRFDTAALKKALNAVLPSDIAVREVRTVSDDFHPRYSAQGKRYVYQILNSDVPDPFLQRYALQVRTPIDEKALQPIADLFVGTHDFSAFCSAGSSVEDKVRTIRRSTLSRQGSLVTYTVEADGFLYNMVRILVGTLLDVQNGRLTADDVRQALTTGERRFAGVTAPPTGLFLDEVWYETSQIE